MTIDIGKVPIGTDTFKEIMRLLKEDADTNTVEEPLHRVNYKQNLLGYLIDQVPRLRMVYTKIKSKNINMVDGATAKAINAFTPELRAFWLFCLVYFFQMVW